MAGKDVVVIIEHWAGEADGSSLQLLGKGRELADALGSELVAAVLGDQVDPLVAALQSRGVDRIVTVADARLRYYNGDTYTHVLARLVGQLQPALVLTGYTLVGMELGPALAARLGAPLLTNGVDVELRDGQVVVARPLFGGIYQARVAIEAAGPAVVTIQKGAFPVRDVAPRQARVEAMPAALEGLQERCRVIEVTEQPAGALDITKADILVGVGRGVGEAAKIPQCQALADALGGGTCCTRPLVDLGWLPVELQVGTSGKTVAPNVFISLGTSGASQHSVGMKDSRLIIAINKDPGAPIFQIAHCGVVADMFTLLPLLTQEAAKLGR